MSEELSFRRLTRDDLGPLHEWLQRPHVRRWWTPKETYEEVVAHYLPAIEGSDPTELYVIVLGECAVGFIQTYLVDDDPEFATRIEVGENVAGVDLFLAEEALTGRGLGSEALCAFVCGVVFARLETTACIADPDVRNTASIRAFEKAGFRRIRDYFDPGDGQTHALLRRDRTSL